MSSMKNRQFLYQVCPCQLPEKRYDYLSGSKSPDLHLYTGKPKINKTFVGTGVEQKVVGI